MTLKILILTVAITTIFALIVFLFIRINLRRKIKSKGWKIDTDPDLSITFGLNIPPFGCGFKRKVNDHITGHSKLGIPFNAFDYSSSFSNAKMVVTLPLPRSLPEIYISSQDDIPQLANGSLIAVDNLRISARDNNYATAIYNAISLPLKQLASINPINITIDHSFLVATGLRKNVDFLSKFIDNFSLVQQAICATNLQHWQNKPGPNYLSFYNHGDWHYTPRDDSMLDYVTYTTYGYDHEARDVITSENFGIPFIALMHHWKTESTDSDGDRSVTRHKEPILEFKILFPFRPLSINAGHGHKIKFESEEFNKAYKVRCPMPKFASDIIHPRQMDFIMNTDAHPFEILSDNRVTVEVPDIYLNTIEMSCYFFHGFFARIPDFVYQDLGAWPRPLPKTNFTN